MNKRKAKKRRRKEELIEISCGDSYREIRIHERHYHEFEIFQKHKMKRCHGCKHFIKKANGCDRVFEFKPCIYD